MPILAGLMTSHIQQVPHTATIREAAKIMSELRVGSLLVEEDGHYIGILTEQDLVRKVLAGPVDPALETVAAHMSSPIITLDANASPEEAEIIMAERRLRHIVVTRKGKIVGIISIRDLLLYYKNRSEQLALE